MGADGEGDPSADLRAWLGSGGRAMEDAGVLDGGLVHVAQRTYRLPCDWKVYCDNFLARRERRSRILGR